MQVRAPLPSIFVTDGTRLNTVRAMPANEPYINCGSSPSDIPGGAAAGLPKRDIHHITVHISTRAVRLVTSALTPMGRAVEKSSPAMAFLLMVKVSPPCGAWIKSLITAKKITAPAVESVTPSMPAAAAAPRMSVTPGKNLITVTGCAVT